MSTDFFVDDPVQDSIEDGVFGSNPFGRDTFCLVRFETREARFSVADQVNFNELNSVTQKPNDYFVDDLEVLWVDVNNDRSAPYPTATIALRWAQSDPITGLLDEVMRRNKGMVADENDSVAIYMGVKSKLASVLSDPEEMQKHLVFGGMVKEIESNYSTSGEIIRFECVGFEYILYKPKVTINEPKYLEPGNDQEDKKRELNPITYKEIIETYILPTINEADVTFRLVLASEAAPTGEKRGNKKMPGAATAHADLPYESINDLKVGYERRNTRAEESYDYGYGIDIEFLTSDEKPSDLRGVVMHEEPLMVAIKSLFRAWLNQTSEIEFQRKGMQVFVAPVGTHGVLTARLIDTRIFDGPSPNVSDGHGISRFHLWRQDAIQAINVKEYSITDASDNVHPTVVVHGFYDVTGSVLLGNWTPMTGVEPSTIRGRRVKYYERYPLVFGDGDQPNMPKVVKAEFDPTEDKSKLKYYKKPLVIKNQQIDSTEKAVKLAASVLNYVGLPRIRGYAVLVPTKTDFAANVYNSVVRLYEHRSNAASLHLVDAMIRDGLAPPTTKKNQLGRIQEVLTGMGIRRLLGIFHMQSVHHRYDSKGWIQRMGFHQFRVIADAALDTSVDNLIRKFSQPVKTISNVTKQVVRAEIEEDRRKTPSLRVSAGVQSRIDTSSGRVLIAASDAISARVISHYSGGVSDDGLRSGGIYFPVAVDEAKLVYSTAGFGDVTPEAIIFGSVEERVPIINLNRHSITMLHKSGSGFVLNHGIGSNVIDQSRFKNNPGMTSVFGRGVYVFAGPQWLGSARQPFHRSRAKTRFNWMKDKVREALIGHKNKEHCSLPVSGFPFGNDGLLFIIDGEGSTLATRVNGSTPEMFQAADSLLLIGGSDVGKNIISDLPASSAKIDAMVSAAPTSGVLIRCVNSSGNRVADIRIYSNGDLNIDTTGDLTASADGDIAIGSSGGISIANASGDILINKTTGAVTINGNLEVLP